MIIYLTNINSNIQDLPFETSTITKVIEHEDSTEVISDYWDGASRYVKESEDYILDRVESPEKFNPYYVVSCHDSRNNYKVLGITRRLDYVQCLAYIYDGLDTFKVESYEEREHHFIMSVYRDGIWLALDNLDSQEECLKAANRQYSAEVLSSFETWKGLINE